MLYDQAFEPNHRKNKLKGTAVLKRLLSRILSLWLLHVIAIVLIIIVLFLNCWLNNFNLTSYLLAILGPYFTSILIDFLYEENWRKNTINQRYYADESINWDVVRPMATLYLHIFNLHFDNYDKDGKNISSEKILRIMYSEEDFWYNPITVPHDSEDQRLQRDSRNKRINEILKTSKENLDYNLMLFNKLILPNDLMKLLDLHELLKLINPGDTDYSRENEEGDANPQMDASFFYVLFRRLKECEEIYKKWDHE